MITNHKLKTKHIVQIFLDIERPTGFILTEKFVNYRLAFFKEYTYASLMKQTFKDFEIWLICGRRHRRITQGIALDRVKVIYPVGTDVIGDSFTINPQLKSVPKLRIKEFEELDNDYIAITRVDSDDMLRRDAMESITDRTRLYINQCPRERVRLLFRNYIYWDMVYHFISFQRWENPPFYTHIFPRDIYHNWDRLQREHFNNHRFMGGGITTELSPNMVLVTHHKQNMARIKRNVSLRDWKNSRLRKFKKRGFKIVSDPEIMNKHLKEFGMEIYMRTHLI